MSPFAVQKRDSAASAALRGAGKHGLRPHRAFIRGQCVRIAAFLALTSCAAPTQPLALGCTLTQDIAAPPGYVVTASAHYAVCPAPARASTYAWRGVVYSVAWD